MVNLRQKLRIWTNSILYTVSWIASQCLKMLLRAVVANISCFLISGILAFPGFQTGGNTKDKACSDRFLQLSDHF